MGLLYRRKNLPHLSNGCVCSRPHHRKLPNQSNRILVNRITSIVGAFCLSKMIFCIGCLAVTKTVIGRNLEIILEIGSLSGFGSHFHFRTKCYLFRYRLFWQAGFLSNFLHRITLQIHCACTYRQFVDLILQEPWSSTFLANWTEPVETLSIEAASGWEIETEISVLKLSLFLSPPCLIFANLPATIARRTCQGTCTLNYM